MSMSLGTLAITASKPVIFQAPNDGVKAILIGCESGLTCTVTMESGGVQKTLYPGTVDWFSVNKGFNGNIKISPIAILNNVSTFPASTLVFDAIGLNDSEQASMYPVALPSRNTNIGNSVNTVGGGSSFVQNDANVAATSIVEATVSGDSTSAVSLTNDAIFALGDTLHPGSLTTKGPINAQGAGTGLAVTNNETVGGTLVVTGDTTLNGAGTGLAVANNETVGGTLGVTGVINANGGINANTIRDDTNGNTAMDLSAGTGAVDFKQAVTFDLTPNLVTGILNGRGSNILNYTGANTHVICPGAGAIDLDVNSVNIVAIDGTGLTATKLTSGSDIVLGGGQLIITDGKMKHFNGGSIACGNGTSISHGLSTTPRMVVGMPGITQPGSATSGVGSIGATTFTATIGAGTLLLWTAWHE